MALSAAVIALYPICPSTHPAASQPGVGASSTRTEPKPPTAALATIHGRRRPKCDRVRSDRWPKTGFAISAASAPEAITNPSELSLVSGAISNTFAGSDTVTAVMIGPSAANSSSPIK